MMDQEEFGERRQSNPTPTIALTIAGLLMLIVGVKSYGDYIRSQCKKEYAEKERVLLERLGYEVAPVSADGNQIVKRGALPQTVPARPVQAVVPPQTQSNQPSQQDINRELAATAQQMGVESMLPSPSDPELDSFRNSLDQVKRQTRQTEQRFRDITIGDVGDLGDVQAKSDEELLTPTDEITEELPPFLRDAVADPPGGHPEEDAKLERMRNRIKNAPTLAQVTSFDQTWNVVTFNAGKQQNVQKDQRFAVRRGTTIVGWVKVDKVLPSESVAVLVTRTNDQTVKKPAVGDDLINFELF